MNKEMYDYIVIGSGPAGAVIAKTLTDDRRNSVLLLEAGANNDRNEPIKNSTLAPMLSSHYFPQYFWQGEEIPQADVNNRVFHWSGGRLLGGGSSVNIEQYVRPTPATFNQWQSLNGHQKRLQKDLRNWKNIMESQIILRYMAIMDILI